MRTKIRLYAMLRNVVVFLYIFENTFKAFEKFTEVLCSFVREMDVCCLLKSNEVSCL